MKLLSHHIVENANTARGVRKKRRRDREPTAEDEPVRVFRSLGLDGAMVALPGAIDLKTRAEADEQLLGSACRFSVPECNRRRALCEWRALAGARKVCFLLAMSALHPKADICGATRDVRFGPGHCGNSDLKLCGFAASLFGTAFIQAAAQHRYRRLLPRIGPA